MKKLFAAAAMMVVLAGSASAQGGGGGMQMTPEQMQQMTAQRIDAVYKGVTVSDDVKKKAIEIWTKAQADSRAVDRQAPDAADQRKKITDKRNADLVALVSSDADKKTVTDNIAALPTGRGGRPPVR